MNKIYIYELKVKVLKEFICSTEHFYPNEIYEASETDEAYMVKMKSNATMVVPKAEFNQYFEIINEKYKCKYCNDTGLIQIAPNVRGLKKCPYCN